MSAADLDQKKAKLAAAKQALLERRVQGTSYVAAAEHLIHPAESRDRIPLSFAQQRLWFLDQLEPNNTAYNVYTAVRVSGEFSIPAYRQTLNEIVNRHEVLRTTFDTVGGEPVQIIGKPGSLIVPVIDLSALGETERQAESL